MQTSGPNAEFSRFQQEIMESQIFDKLKQQLGTRDFSLLIEAKIKTLPFNFVSPFCFALLGVDA